MKRLVAAACLALTPTAWAEHGTQLAQWSSSSPNQSDPAPAAAPAAATPAPAPGTDPQATAQKKEEKKGPATITAVTTPDQLAAISGLNWQASLDTYLGQGTFINAGLYAYAASAVDLSARYSFKVGGVKLAVSGRGYVSWEYTLPDTSNGRRVSWRDLSFGLSAPAIYKNAFTGISVTPSLSFSVPITMESWMATTITVMSAGLNFTRVIGPVHLSLSTSATRGFHRSPIIANLAKDDTDAAGVKMLIARQGESNANVIGTNTAWGFSTSLAATWVATDALSFDISYGIRMGWKYNIVPAGDPNQSQIPGRVCESNCRGGDLSIAQVAVNYQISDHWSASFFVYTAQKPKSDTNGDFRFPFWSFEPENNYSSLGLSLGASF